MNIDLTEKFQAQSSHYSGAQQTLHCIIIEGEGVLKYVYHLPDDTNHDSIMTFTIIQDIIQKYPCVTKDGCLVLHSDNASSQYKCKYTFYKMQELARENNLVECWFYGEPGHGKGTIDAMPSFGCKTPMRKKVMWNVIWFEKAEDMVVFLKDQFKNDETKEHYYIDAEVVAEERKKPRSTFCIKGNRKMHLIAVSPGGEVFTMLHYRDEAYVLNLSFFDKPQVKTIVNMELENNGEEEEDSDSDEIMTANRNDYLHEVIEPGTFVALRCPVNSLELFFVVEALAKDAAFEEKLDDNGHCVLKGEKYFEVHYLEKRFGGRQTEYVEYTRSILVKCSCVSWNLGLI